MAAVREDYIMRSRFLGTVFAAGLAAFAGLGFTAAPASAQKVLKMQASWPAVSRCSRTSSSSPSAWTSSRPAS